MTTQRLLEACKALINRHVDCLEPRSPCPEQDYELFEAAAAVAEAERKSQPAAV